MAATMVGTGWHARLSVWTRESRIGLRPGRFSRWFADSASCVKDRCHGLPSSRAKDGRVAF